MDLADLKEKQVRPSAAWALARWALMTVTADSLEFSGQAGLPWHSALRLQASSNV